MPLADLITVFCSKLVFVFDAHSPIVAREITVRPKKQSLSVSTESLKIKRNKAYIDYKITNSEKHYAELKHLNKEFKTCLWKDTKDNINTTIAAKGIHFAANSLCKLGKKLDSKFYFLPNVINDYFVSVSTLARLPNPTSYPDKPDHISTPNVRFKVQPIMAIEILMAWHSM